MNQNFQFVLENPKFESMGYVVAVANIEDKHDRSAPSDYHWKILKCRMMIFSNSSILASPDKKDVKRIHIIINKVGDDFDKLNSLFIKFSLMQEGEIREVSTEIFHACLQYTIIAKLAPTWNVVGFNFLVNNRNFLTATEAQCGVEYTISCSEKETTLNLKAIKIFFIRPKETFLPGEWIRVLPSLNKAIIEEYCETLPESSKFKCYKDLRRHWKNIHGYRLDERECGYYRVRFWRGSALSYPAAAVARAPPLVTAVPRHTQVEIISRFISCLKNKMPNILGTPLNLQQHFTQGISLNERERMIETQDISLCTPTQKPTNLH